MRAAILAIGSELLGTDRLDTNSLRFTQLLDDHGVELVGKAVVADDQQRIAAAVRRCLEDADLVLITGGLGPTTDDRSREGVALALGRGLANDEGAADAIRAQFERLGRAMPEVNLRQAQVIAGAKLLANPRGTAPGQHLTVDGKALFLFPGVPDELEGMIASTLVPWLAERRSVGPRLQRVLKVACLPESEVEERLAPLYARFGPDGIGLLPTLGEVALRLAALGSDAGERLEAMAQVARDCLGRAIYAESAEATLEAVVGRRLDANHATVATAESCTGGLVAERLTRVPGSSGYFVGSVVAYADHVKERALGVPRTLIEQHGAVSREVAEAMAVGCRDRFDVVWSVAVTGIAGPTGGSPDKPVGSVHVAVAGPRGRVCHLAQRFPGDRRVVRRLASQWALDLLRTELEA